MSTENPDQLAGCGTASPVLAERTAQQPVVEEPVEEIPPEPQQTSGPTSVPKQLVEKTAEQSINALSTNPAEADTLAPREPDRAEEQQPELAQSTLADATARGKAIVVAETTISGPAPPLNKRLKRMKSKRS